MIELCFAWVGGQIRASFPTPDIRLLPQDVRLLTIYVEFLGEIGVCQLVLIGLAAGLGLGSWAIKRCRN